MHVACIRQHSCNVLGLHLIVDVVDVGRSITVVIEVKMDSFWSTAMVCSNSSVQEFIQLSIFHCQSVECLVLHFGKVKKWFCMLVLFCARC